MLYHIGFWQLHKIFFYIHTYIFYVYKFFFSETSCDFNECIQGCPYVKIGLNQGCSEACNKNQTFQKNTTCVDLCKKTSQQFMTSIIGRDLVLLNFLGFKSVFKSEMMCKSYVSCYISMFINLSMTTKNETTNSPIHEFKVHMYYIKAREPFKPPFYLMVYVLFLSLTFSF